MGCLGPENQVTGIRWQEQETGAQGRHVTTVWYRWEPAHRKGGNLAGQQVSLNNLIFPRKGCKGKHTPEKYWYNFHLSTKEVVRIVQFQQYITSGESGLDKTRNQVLFTRRNLWESILPKTRETMCAEVSYYLHHSVKLHVLRICELYFLTWAHGTAWKIFYLMLLYLKEYFVDCNSNFIFPNLAAYYKQSCSSSLSPSLIWLFCFLSLKLHRKCKMMTFVNVTTWMHRIQWKRTAACCRERYCGRSWETSPDC